MKNISISGVNAVGPPCTHPINPIPHNLTRYGGDPDEGELTDEFHLPVAGHGDLSLCLDRGSPSSSCTTKQNGHAPLLSSDDDDSPI